MRNSTTIRAEAMRKIWRSRPVGAGMEPSHHERAGRRTGWNADHEVPRLIVDHESCSAVGIPVQGRTTAFRTRSSTGRAPASHHEVSRAGRGVDEGVFEELGPTCSTSTRPQDGHRSDSHGMTAWQKGQGRYPVGMSPYEPFIFCHKFGCVLSRCSSSIRDLLLRNAFRLSGVSTTQGYAIKAAGPSWPKEPAACFKPALMFSTSLSASDRKQYVRAQLRSSRAPAPCRSAWHKGSVCGSDSQRADLPVREYLPAG
jgi:hypothetical protein